MAAKSDGLLKMKKKSDVAFTPLQNSEHSYSGQHQDHGQQQEEDEQERERVSAEPGSAELSSRCCTGLCRGRCLRFARHQRYTLWDGLWIVAAVTVYFSDVGTDVWLAVDYYLHSRYWWFGLTLFFVVLGSLAVQVFSFRWFIHDFSANNGAGANSTSPVDGKLLSSAGGGGESDARSPQRHPSTTRTKNTSKDNKTSSCSFCVWLLQSIIHILQLGQLWRYLRTIYLGIRSRRSGEHDRWRFYWKMVYEYADVSMLHLLATFLESAPQLVLQLCIVIQSHRLEALQGRTRCRLFIYYFVILLENTALSALWYLYRAPQITDAFAIPALCVVFSSFLTGIVFMLMYYAFFHPNGPRFGQSPSCACKEPAATFNLPAEAAANALRAVSQNREQKFTERDGCMPVFQVRPTVPSTPSSRTPRIEETVIKIDLLRNKYPAWDRHVLDRSLRKAILAFECSSSAPQLQYKDEALIEERLEYETTL
ncbi:XK-related protein 4 isoform X2 [Heterodontus francisci]|uniref:XK-related protein 4 isoform X2 n=1 Tax=Heterodontus francisci TaxID=7792 RepID=UPI00355C67D2